MRVVIAGCGRVGRDLARSLTEEGHDVSVIDHRPEMLDRLGSTFDGSIHRGLGYDVELLTEAGIEFADAFVAVTNEDNANVMAVQVAKRVFRVPKTIARLDEPARADSYSALDIEYVAGARLISRVFHELLVDVEFHYHVTFSGGDVEIVEMVMGPGAAGLAVGDLEIDGELRVAAVRRGSRTLIPGPEFTIREHDLVVGAVRSGVRSKVKQFLAPRRPVEPAP